jgi:PAS domain S-box-containing protein
MNRIITKNGDVRWLDMTVAMIEYDGKPAVLGNAFDITDRKKAEEERERLNLQLQQAAKSLKESEAKFRTLAETTTAAIFIHQGGKILYANPASGSVAGYTNEEFLSMNFWSIIHPDFQALVQERGQARLRGDQTLPESNSSSSQGEERWVLMTAGVIEYEGKPAVIALCSTSRCKQAEEEKVKLYEQRIAEETARHGKRSSWTCDGIRASTNISILSEVGQRPRTWKASKTLSTARLPGGISEVRSFMQSLDTQS